MEHDDEPLRIPGFGDAAAAAFGIRDRFRRAHGYALLDADGTVLDLRVCTLRKESIEWAVRWAEGMAKVTPGVTHAVLFSAVRKGVADELREADVELLRDARARLAESDVLLVDWLQCDAEHVRSIDLASDGRGWDQAASVA